MPKTHKLSHGPPRKTSMILYTCHLYNTFPFLHTSMNLCTCHLYNTFPFLHTSMILCTCHLYNRPFNRTFLSPAASPTFIVPLRFFFMHILWEFELEDSVGKFDPLPHSTCLSLPSKLYIPLSLICSFCEFYVMFYKNSLYKIDKRKSYMSSQI